MQTHYHTRRARSELVASYVCVRRGRPYAEPMCQSILGETIDGAIGRLLVDTVQPKAVDLALAVHDEIQARVDESDRLRHRQVERAQYEADAARHLHAGRSRESPGRRSLEADWNERLRALAAAREELRTPARGRQGRPR